MKAVLLIEEMPTECIECQFCRVLADNKPTETHCLLTAKRNEDGVNTRAEWCPLKSLPQKMTMEKALKMERVGAIKDIYTTWNACLDEILGEAE